MPSGLANKKSSLFRDVQIAVVAVLFTFAVVSLATGSIYNANLRPDYPVLLTFMPSAVLTSVALLLEMRRRPYSLHLMHLAASIVLLVFAPAVQTIRGVFPGGLQLSAQQIIWANLCVFIWILSYVLSERFFRRRFSRVELPFPLLERTLSVASLQIGALLAVAALSYLAYRGTGGAATRAAFGAAYAAQSTMDVSAVKVVRALPVIVLAGWLMLLILFPRRRTWAAVGVIVILIGGNVAFNNPLAAARYWTGTLFLALSCVVFLRKVSTATVLFPGALLGILILPSINLGRSQTEFELRMLTVRDGQSVRAVLETGDFDAYANLVMINKLIELEGITYGRQLSGVLLFWLPRSIWESKPTGTGTFAAERLNLVWANIAAPLPAEALVNFGVFGIAPCAVVFAGLLYFADARYYLNRNGAPPEMFRPLDVLYPFWLGLIAFATRGDLINGFSFVVAVTAAGVVGLRLFNRPRRPD